MDMSQEERRSGLITVRPPYADARTKSPVVAAERGVEMAEAQMRPEAVVGIIVGVKLVAVMEVLLRQRSAAD